MKSLHFTTNHWLVNQQSFNEIKTHLGPEIKRIRDAAGTQYTTRYASINAPSDVRVLEQINKLVQDKEKHDALVLVGIGGSNLGTLAILQALYGEHYHQIAKKKFYCADNVDTFKMREIVEAVRALLASGKKVLLIISSKSGSTTETIANAAVFIELLKEYDPEHYNRSIVAITDHDSSLWFIAQSANWSVLEVPMLIGGRYSVFSTVGLFPLAMMGIDINLLQEGAYFMRERCISDTIEENFAARSAIYLFDQYQQKRRIHDTFIFTGRLEEFGAWYRQLMAESLGKKRDDGTEVGITPTISIGSTDLHSMAQLYLGGPNERCTTFITVENEGAPITIPSGPLTGPKSHMPFLAGLTLQEVMDAIFKGVQQAYEEDKRPFVTINLTEITPQALGALMQMKMLEIMYLGYLLKVNPFDQPDVEKYKKVTSELLNS